MKAWYLHHSGFAVESAAHTLVFDYEKDSPRGHFAQGVVDPALLRGRGPVVFISHAHGDHCNRAVFGWRAQAPETLYVLSKDVRAPEGENAARLAGGDTARLPGVEVRALASTDEGVAFLVKTDGLTLYHAGDLNWWHWAGESAAYNEDMARRYRREIDALQGENIDLAFVPVDPRLQESALWGLDYFMRTAGAAAVAPMHFWDDFSVFERLLADPCTAGYRDKIVRFSRRGECLALPAGLAGR